MVSGAESTQQGRVAQAMGLESGQVMQELGWDSDVDEDLRLTIMDVIEEDLVEDAVEAVDSVLLWWRDEDGDLVDGLVDAMTDLSSTGIIWLATPKVGRSGHVEPSEIDEAVSTAGLTLTTPVDLSKSWQVQKVVRSGRR